MDWLKSYLEGQVSLSLVSCLDDGNFELSVDVGLAAVWGDAVGSNFIGDALGNGGAHRRQEGECLESHFEVVFDNSSDRLSVSRYWGSGATWALKLSLRERIADRQRRGMGERRAASPGG